MGYTPEFFWSLAPQEFSALFEAWKEQQRVLDRRVGRICATIANVNRDPKKQPRPYSEDDFIPQTEERPPQSLDTMLAVVKALNKVYGGTGGEE